MYSIIDRQGRTVLSGYQSLTAAKVVARDLGCQVRRMADPICRPRSLAGVFGRG